MTYLILLGQIAGGLACLIVILGLVAWTWIFLASVKRFKQAEKP